MPKWDKCVCINRINAHCDIVHNSLDLLCYVWRIKLTRHEVLSIQFMNLTGFVVSLQVFVRFMPVKEISIWALVEIIELYFRKKRRRLQFFYDKILDLWKVYLTKLCHPFFVRRYKMCSWKCQFWSENTLVIINFSYFILSVVNTYLPERFTLALHKNLVIYLQIYKNLLNELKLLGASCFPCKDAIFVRLCI